MIVAPQKQREALGYYARSAVGEVILRGVQSFDPGATTLTVKSLVEATGLLRQQVVDGLRLLGDGTDDQEGIGLGRFVMGRRGHPSRLELNEGALELLQEFAGVTGQVTMEHRLLLRPGVEVVLVTPSQLEPGDRERISKFVDAALPAGSAQDTNKEVIQE